VWWWLGVLACLALAVVFRIASARALPSTEDSKKVITRFEQFRGLGHALSGAFKPQPRDLAMEDMLEDLDRMKGAKD
jgi:hypothetical protein